MVVLVVEGGGLDGVIPGTYRVEGEIDLGFVDHFFLGGGFCFRRFFFHSGDCFVFLFSIGIGRRDE